MTPAARWLDTLWPLIRARLPAAPARVVEVGCGSLGGFVPMLRADGYDAVGIDPQHSMAGTTSGSSSSAPSFLSKSTPSSPPPHSITSPNPASVIDRITSALIYVLTGEQMANKRSGLLSV